MFAPLGSRLPLLPDLVPLLPGLLLLLSGLSTLLCGSLGVATLLGGLLLLGVAALLGDLLLLGAAILLGGLLLLGVATLLGGFLLLGRTILLGLAGLLASFGLVLTRGTNLDSLNRSVFGGRRHRGETEDEERERRAYQPEVGHEFSLLSVELTGVS